MHPDNRPMTFLYGNEKEDFSGWKNWCIGTLCLVVSLLLIFGTLYIIVAIQQTKIG